MKTQRQPLCNGLKAPSSTGKLVADAKLNIGCRLKIRELRKRLPLKAWKALYNGQSVQVSGNRYLHYWPELREYRISMFP